jgi:hypothetical protein
MKTKSASKSKKTSGAGSKLASLKNALFGSAKPAAAQAGKKTAVEKTSSKKPMKASPSKAPAKPAPVKAAVVKPTKKLPAPLVAAPVKPAKAAKPAKVAPPQTAKQVEAAKKGVAAAAGKALANAKAAKSPLLSKSAANSGRGMSDSEVCREVACEGLGTTAGYCRLHYIKNWRKIKRKEIILKEGKLNQYIEELVAKYPDKYIEAIRLDLASDKEFAKVISDLDLDESADDFEGDGENIDALVDNIKRDFDDEGDAF